jgi:hypothetical protein
MANRNVPKSANNDVQFLANKNAHFLSEEGFLSRRRFPFFHLNQIWENKTT